MRSEKNSEQQNQTKINLPQKEIGVLKDFNYQSLKDQIKPLAMVLGGQPNYEIAIRLTPGKTQEKN